MKKYFDYEESPCMKGKYLIKVNDEAFPIENGTSGSYNVLCARVLNLSYAQYLRMCRDICGAEIIGKNVLYPVAYFERNEGLMSLLKLLNKSAQFLIFRKEHPYEFEKDGKILKKVFDDGHIEVAERGK